MSGCRFLNSLSLTSSRPAPRQDRAAREVGKTSSGVVVCWCRSADDEGEMAAQTAAFGGSTMIIALRDWHSRLRRTKRLRRLLADLPTATVRDDLLNLLAGDVGTPKGTPVRSRSPLIRQILEFGPAGRSARSERSSHPRNTRSRRSVDHPVNTLRCRHRGHSYATFLT